MHRFSYFILLLFLAACTKAPQDGTRYYDLESFFTQEKQRLQGKPIQKTVSINGKTDKQKVAFSAEEFTLFLKANINDPSFMGKYGVDSTFAGEVLQKLNYTAKEPKLKTRSVEIDFEGGNVKAVRFFVATKNVIYSSEQNLSYRPGVDYEIKVIQDQAFTAPMKFEALGEF